MLHSLKIKIYYLAAIFFLPGILLAETTLYKYAINLESSKKKSAILIHLKDFNVSDNYKIYQTEVSLGKNNYFYRLRLGFFSSKVEAERVARKFKSKYSKLWVDRLHKQDRKFLAPWLASKKKSQPEIIITNSADKEKLAQKFMLRAEKAMKDSKYRLAVSLYTRIIELGNTSKLQQSMEYLGLAREKNRQLIHARAEYRLYLKKYPKGDDAKRVRQRLFSLQTLLLKPRSRLKKRDSNSIDGRFFGSILQFYRNDVFSSDASKTSIETLSTNVNFLYRKKSESFNIKSQLNVNHLKYINNSSKDDRSRFNTFFVDVADVNNIKSIKLGRQSQNKGGVFGRMDGAWASYRLNPTWKLNAVLGYPVQTSISNIAQKNRPFWGVSTDIGTIAKYWNINVYTMNQKIDYLIDRNAVGGEVRYRINKQNHFALIDYDTYFSELNTFFYVGNWRFDNDISVIFTFNHRNSPILTTTNATQGQSTPSIEGLLQTYTEDELKQYAKDRTSKYNSSSISTTIPLSKKWSFYTDLTLSNLSSTPSSAGVSAIEGTGDEYYFGVQFIGYDVFSSQETTRYQVRYSDSKSYERTQFTLSSRFNLKNNKWRLRPQIMFESRINKNGGNTTKVRPSIRTDYKLQKRLKLDIDVSYEVSETTFPVSLTENNYYISAGLIWDF